MVIVSAARPYGSGSSRIIMLIHLRQHVAVLCGGKVQAGRILRDADAQLDRLSDCGFELFPREILLLLVFAASRLKMSAVDDKVSVIDIEQIAGGVKVDVPAVGINHIACEIDRAGALAVVCAAPRGGVDDRQRGTVCDGNGIAVMRGQIGVILVVITVVIAVAVKADIHGVSVQVEHLVCGNDHCLPRVAVCFSVAVIRRKCNIGIIGVGGFQCRTERIRIIFCIKHFSFGLSDRTHYRA